MLKAKKRILFHIFLIAIFAMLAMSISFYNGLTSGNDFQQHFQFARTIYDSIISGQFYPSWADTVNHGYGDVALRFYPPMGYYALAFAYFFVGNWYYAGLLTFTLIFFAGGIGIYLWAREEFSSEQALIAAGIFIFAPYHLNQIYNNFLYAEFASSALIPFCFLFITRICKSGKLGDMFGLSIFYALLILTHLPLTIISSIVFGIYALGLQKKTTFFKTTGKLFGSVLIALSASSFYWLRMVSELEWMHHSDVRYFSDIYSYTKNFLFSPQNILNFETDASVLWLADMMLLGMILISIPSIIFVVRNRKKLSRFQLTLTAVAFFSVFMTTPLSKFIWDNLAFLQKAQFPWRWMGIVSVVGSLFASIGIKRVSETINDNKNHLVTIGHGIIFIYFVFTSTFIMKQAVFLPSAEFSKQMEKISDSRSFDCWWTIWAKLPALQIKEKVIAENREIEIRQWHQLERVFEISEGNAQNVRVATFYYPHWKAEVNGLAVEVQKDDNGVILIPVQSDKSSVRLYFQEPNKIKFAFAASITIWIILLGTIVFSFRKKSYPDQLN